MQKWGMNVRIWVVDDESGILQVIEAVLAGAGHVVHTFGSVAHLDQVISAAQTTPPDLVLMDAMVSGENGLVVAEKLQNFWGPGVRLVMMSGDSEMAKNVPETMGWLRKPFHLDELMRLVASPA